MCCVYNLPMKREDGVLLKGTNAAIATGLRSYALLFFAH